MVEVLSGGSVHLIERLSRLQRPAQEIDLMLALAHAGVLRGPVIYPGSQAFPQIMHATLKHHTSIRFR